MKGVEATLRSVEVNTSKCCASPNTFWVDRNTFRFSEQQLYLGNCVQQKRVPEEQLDIICISLEATAECYLDD